VDWKPGPRGSRGPLVTQQEWPANLDADLNSAPQGSAREPQVVDTESGPITMIDLVGLRTHLAALQAQADKSTRDAESLRALSEDLWVQAGKALVTLRAKWSPSVQVSDLVQQASTLQQKIATDDSELESIQHQERGGISGLAGRLGTWNQGRKLSDDRAQSESQLLPLLSQIARQSTGVQLPEIESMRNQAIAAEAQVQELEQHSASLSAATTLAAEELKRRTDAQHELGFDAPYLVAYLKTKGPQEIQSPLILKRGERANWVTPAILARQQTRSRWVGGSQGFSFPIGHTGIRYRVGSFHGHPIQQQFLGKLDGGSLVITNQRIAFIGKSKSTSIPYAKLVHVECYSDAVAVFQEGRENPDFYLTPQPKYALFMINWFLNQTAG
jgi:hypothetical protein